MQLTLHNFKLGPITYTEAGAEDTNIVDINFFACPLSAPTATWLNTCILASLYSGVELNIVCLIHLHLSPDFHS